jgi:hypothetical protein
LPELSAGEMYALNANDMYNMPSIYYFSMRESTDMEMMVHVGPSRLLPKGWNLLEFVFPLTAKNPLDDIMNNNFLRKVEIIN